MAIDANIIDGLMPCVMAFSGGADNGDPVAGIPQGVSLLPDPPVKGDGEVLHDDQDPTPGSLSAAFGGHAKPYQQIPS